LDSKDTVNLLHYTSAHKSQGYGGIREVWREFRRARAKIEPAPAACSFRVEPSKILFSLLEEFFSDARKNKIVKSILLGSELQRTVAGLSFITNF